MTSAPPDLPFDPFASKNVGDPWKSPEPDIPSINAEPFEKILGLLRQMRHTQQLAALVMGEAGSGKTHLIKRLMNQQLLKLIFVYVHPLKNHHMMFGSLLERVLTNLDRKIESEFTQLDLISAHVIVATLENYSKSGGKVAPKTLETIRRTPTAVFGFKKKDATWDKILHKSREFLDNSLSADRISRMVSMSLFQYLDKDKRNAARQFLSGYIPDEEDSKMLGLSFAESDLSSAAQEDRSKQILKAIGQLLGFYRPMILCFDQLEALNTPEPAASFGTMISEMVNEVDNVLPVLFMRPDTLESNFSLNQCDKAVRDRLASNVFPLQVCNLEQALDMIKARLAWAFQGSDQRPPHAFHPFNEQVLRKEILKDGHTPRSILTRAGKLMDSNFEPEDPVAVVLRSFQSEREQLLADSKKEHFVKDTILEALKLYFAGRSNNPKYTVVEHGPKGRMDFRLIVSPSANKEEKRTLDMAVETACHGRTLVKRLDVLIDAIKGGEADFVIFLRDSLAPIPPSPGKMPKTAQKLKEFEDCGGIKLYLDYNLLADLCALIYTRNKIPPGDLSYVANEGGDQQAVEMKHFDDFVERHFKSPFFDDIETRLLNGKISGTTTPTGITNAKAKELVSRIKQILGNPPYMFKLEHIDFQLKQHKDALQISVDELAVLISSHRKEIEQLAVTPPIYRLR